MPLSAGSRFGPYEIVAPIGAGGMGEVYRARDTALHRFVAIKVLPDRVARDPQRVARFAREARTLASLNDPNIAAIYGLETAGAARALVLELVEGPTLADRVARGALSVSESLAIARQIAKALDAAHQQGIVHRDLKPANVKVREDGTVKVLDFGLAKAFDQGSTPETSGAPTVTAPTELTGAGVIIGTAAYMAPEQAKGIAADKRADIWAFGCVLYEMLTGRRAFKADGVTETLAAVLRGEPDWAALPPELPAATRTLLQRCLEKDRGARVQDISTARFVLDEQASLSAMSAPLPRAAAPRPPRRRVAAWIAVAALAGAAGGAEIVWSAEHHAAAAARMTRFEISSSQHPVSASVFGSLLALSPDGSDVVYVSMSDGVSRLVRRRLNRLEPEPIPGTDGALDPFFSPDGREVGFIVAGELRRIAIDGGKSVTIWRGDPTFEGAAWTSDGTIVFSHDASLYRINASGGERTRIAAPDPTRDEFGLDRPSLLPDSDVILYTAELRGGRSRIAARHLAGGDPVTVLDGGFGAVYVAPGFLVFGQGARAMAIAFDPSTLRVSGAPIELERDIFTNPGDAVFNVAVAPDGTAAFVAGRNSGLASRLVWRSRTGARLGSLLDAPLDQPRNVRLSPDGTRIAAAVGPPGQANIWVYDTRGTSPPVKLTFSDHNTFPVWSPDGRRIAFMREKAGVVTNLVVAADSSSLQPQPIGDPAMGGATMDWHDSALMLFKDSRMFLVHVPETHALPWLPSPFAIYGARFSPDGHLIAYASTQSGATDVWVRPFPGDGAPVRVSIDGGHEPVWSHDGADLYFTRGPKLLMAHMTAALPEPRFDPPRVIVDGGLAYDTSDMVLRFYDVAPDGRILMVEPAETRSASVVVAPHWDEALKALGE